jgi:hypothetical protein
VIISNEEKKKYTNKKKKITNCKINIAAADSFFFQHFPQFTSLIDHINFQMFLIVGAKYSDYCYKRRNYILWREMHENSKPLKCNKNRKYK